jgi:hypothetical protein
VIEIEGVERGSPLRISLSRVDHDFFDVFDICASSPDAGSTQEDFTPNSAVVIVSRHLADGIPGEVLGHRLRHVDDGYGQVPTEPDRWYEMRVIFLSAAGIHARCR